MVTQLTRNIIDLRAATDGFGAGNVVDASGHVELIIPTERIMASYDAWPRKAAQ
jgi:hypothetical protein